LRNHKSQEGFHVKPQHRVGQGTLQVVVPEQVDIDDPYQGGSSDDGDALDGDADLTAQDEEEEDEPLTQESYDALK